MRRHRATLTHARERHDTPRNGTLIARRRTRRNRLGHKAAWITKGLDTSREEA